MQGQFVYNGKKVFTVLIESNHAESTTYVKLGLATLEGPMHYYEGTQTGVSSYGVALHRAFDSARDDYYKKDFYIQEIPLRDLLKSAGQYEFAHAGIEAYVNTFVKREFGKYAVNQVHALTQNGNLMIELDDSDDTYGMIHFFSEIDTENEPLYRANYEAIESILSNYDDLTWVAYKDQNKMYDAYEIFAMPNTPVWGEVIDIVGSLESYPILDEDLYSEIQREYNEKYFEEWGYTDAIRVLEKLGISERTLERWQSENLPSNPEHWNHFKSFLYRWFEDEENYQYGYFKGDIAILANTLDDFLDGLTGTKGSFRSESDGLALEMLRKINALTE